MNLYRNFIVIFLCLFVNWGFNLVESVNPPGSFVQGPPVSPAYPGLVNVAPAGPILSGPPIIGPAIQTTPAPDILILEINNKRSTREIVYERDDSRERDIFTAMGTSLFGQATMNGTVVWTAKNNEYPYRITVKLDDKGDPKIKVYMPEPQSTPAPSPQITAGQANPGFPLVDPNVNVQPDTHSQAQKNKVLTPPGDTSTQTQLNTPTSTLTPGNQTHENRFNPMPSAPIVGPEAFTEFIAAPDLPLFQVPEGAVPVQPQQGGTGTPNFPIPPTGTGTPNFPIPPTGTGVIPGGPLPEGLHSSSETTSSDDFVSRPKMVHSKAALHVDTDSLMSEFGDTISNNQKKRTKDSYVKIEAPGQGGGGASTAPQPPGQHPQVFQQPHQGQVPVPWQFGESSIAEKVAEKSQPKIMTQHQDQSGQFTHYVIVNPKSEDEASVPDGKKPVVEKSKETKQPITISSGKDGTKYGNMMEGTIGNHSSVFILDGNKNTMKTRNVIPVRRKRRRKGKANLQQQVIMVPVPVIPGSTPEGYQLIPGQGQAVPVIIPGQGEAVPVVLPGQGQASPVVIPGQGQVAPVVSPSQGQVAPVVSPSQGAPAVLPQTGPSPDQQVLWAPPAQPVPSASQPMVQPVQPQSPALSKYTIIERKPTAPEPKTIRISPGGQTSGVSTSSIVSDIEVLDKDQRDTRGVRIQTAAARTPVTGAQPVAKPTAAVPRAPGAAASIAIPRQPAPAGPAGTLLPQAQLAQSVPVPKPSSQQPQTIVIDDSPRPAARPAGPETISISAPASTISVAKASAIPSPGSPMAGPAQRPVAVPIPAQAPVSVPIPGQAPVSVHIPGQAAVAVPIPAQAPVSVPIPGQASVAAPIPGKAPVAVPIPGQAPVALAVPPASVPGANPPTSGRTFIIDDDDAPSQPPRTIATTPFPASQTLSLPTSTTVEGEGTIVTTMRKPRKGEEVMYLTVTTSGSSDDEHETSSAQAVKLTPASQSPSTLVIPTAPSEATVAHPPTLNLSIASGQTIPPPVVSTPTDLKLPSDVTTPPVVSTPTDLKLPTDVSTPPAVITPTDIKLTPAITSTPVTSTPEEVKLPSAFTSPPATTIPTDVPPPLAISSALSAGTTGLGVTTLQDQAQQKTEKKRSSDSEEEASAMGMHRYSGPDIKLFRKDPLDPNEFKELELTDYSVEEGEEIVYTMNSNVNCAKILLGDAQVWIYDYAKNDGKYPNSISFNNTYFVFVVKFDGFDLTFEKDNDGNWKARDSTLITPDIKFESGAKTEKPKEMSITISTGVVNSGSERRDETSQATSEAETPSTLVISSGPAEGTIAPPPPLNITIASDQTIAAPPAVSVLVESTIPALSGPLEAPSIPVMIGPTLKASEETLPPPPVPVVLEETKQAVTAEPLAPPAIPVLVEPSSEQASETTKTDTVVPELSAPLDSSTSLTISIPSVSVQTVVTPLASTQPDPSTSIPLGSTSYTSSSETYSLSTPSELSSVSLTPSLSSTISISEDKLSEGSEPIKLTYDSDVSIKAEAQVSNEDLTKSEVNLEQSAQTSGSASSDTIATTLTGSSSSPDESLSSLVVDNKDESSEMSTIALAIKSREQYKVVKEDDIKIVTADSNGTESINDSSKYKFVHQYYGFHYTFNDENKCVRVEFKNSPVWQYDSSKSAHPKSICFRNDTTFVLFEFDPDFELFDSVQNEFRPVTRQEYDDVFSLIKVITEKDGVKTDNDMNAYNQVNYGLLSQYRFNKGYKCTEVMYGDTVAWKHDSAVHNANYPTMLYFDIIAPIMVNLIIDNKRNVVIYYDDMWQAFDHVVSKAQTTGSQSKASDVAISSDLKTASTDPESPSFKVESPSIFDATDKQSTSSTHVSMSALAQASYTTGSFSDVSARLQPIESQSENETSGSGLSASLTHTSDSSDTSISDSNDVAKSEDGSKPAEGSDSSDKSGGGTKSTESSDSSKAPESSDTDTSKTGPNESPGSTQSRGSSSASSPAPKPRTVPSGGPSGGSSTPARSGTSFTLPEEDDDTKKSGSDSSDKSGSGSKEPGKSDEGSKSAEGNESSDLSGGGTKSTESSDSSKAPESSDTDTSKTGPNESPGSTQSRGSSSASSPAPKPRTKKMIKEGIEDTSGSGSKEPAKSVEVSKSAVTDSSDKSGSGTKSTDSSDPSKASDSSESDPSKLVNESSSSLSQPSESGSASAQGPRPRTVPAGSSSGGGSTPSRGGTSVKLPSDGEDEDTSGSGSKEPAKSVEVSKSAVTDSSDKSGSGTKSTDSSDPSKASDSSESDPSKLVNESSSSLSQPSESGSASAQGPRPRTVPAGSSSGGGSTPARGGTTFTLPEEIDEDSKTRPVVVPKNLSKSEDGSKPAEGSDSSDKSGSGTKSLDSSDSSKTSDSTESDPSMTGSKESSGTSTQSSGSSSASSQGPKPRTVPSGGSSGGSSTPARGGTTFTLPEEDEDSKKSGSDSNEVSKSEDGSKPAEGSDSSDKSGSGTKSLDSSDSSKAPESSDTDTSKTGPNESPGSTQSRGSSSASSPAPKPRTVPSGGSSGGSSTPARGGTTFTLPEEDEDSKKSGSDSNEVSKSEDGSKPAEGSDSSDKSGSGTKSLDSSDSSKTSDSTESDPSMTGSKESSGTSTQSSGSSSASSQGPKPRTVPSGGSSGGSSTPARGGTTFTLPSDGEEEDTSVSGSKDSDKTDAASKEADKSGSRSKLPDKSDSGSGSSHSVSTTLHSSKPRRPCGSVVSGDKSESGSGSSLSGSSIQMMPEDDDDDLVTSEDASSRVMIASSTPKSGDGSALPKPAGQASSGQSASRSMSSAPIPANQSSTPNPGSVATPVSSGSGSRPIAKSASPVAGATSPNPAGHVANPVAGGVSAKPVAGGTTTPKPVAGGSAAAKPVAGGTTTPKPVAGGSASPKPAGQASSGQSAPRTMSSGPIPANQSATPKAQAASASTASGTSSDSSPKPRARSDSSGGSGSSQPITIELDD
ncbi:hypothetical protein MACK_003640 [Theileria orientalis]|uniref:Uncharacterized protein n=1 Tax=Theileria orientalis TaxID=68886 RepID=A0A976SJJ6_THEOR|nr:hypothetical protein MACK_003640 [Theileria orientalis]